MATIRLLASESSLPSSRPSLQDEDVERSEPVSRRTHAPLVRLRRPRRVLCHRARGYRFPSLPPVHLSPGSVAAALDGRPPPRVQRVQLPRRLLLFRVPSLGFPPLPFGRDTTCCGVRRPLRGMAGSIRAREASTPRLFPSSGFRNPSTAWSAPGVRDF